MQHQAAKKCTCKSMGDSHKVEGGLSHTLGLGFLGSQGNPIVCHYKAYNTQVDTKNCTPLCWVLMLYSSLP